MRFLLHRLSLADGEAMLVPTTADVVRSASFIDGRTPFGQAAPIRIGLERFLADEAVAAPVMRAIFHVGFCGSTFLSRLLDVPDHSLVLREPNCLTELANQRAANHLSGKSIAGFDAALAAVGRHLARPWRADEAVVVKASNWDNLLLSDLSMGSFRPLFVTSSRRRFVLAVVRGGPSRVAFAARAAVHLSSGDREAAELVALAIGADDDKAGQLARLAAIAHEIQIRQFRAVADKGRWGGAHWLDQDDLIADPATAAAAAAAALDLDLSRESIEANVSAWKGRHAKQPSAHFSGTAECADVAAVEAAHGPDVDHAIEWAARSFGANPSGLGGS